MTTTNPFSKLFEQTQSIIERDKAHEQSQRDFSAAMAVKQTAIWSDWLRQTLEKLRIDSPVNGMSAEANGFRFTIDPELRGGEYPLGVKKGAVRPLKLDDYEPLPFHMAAFDLRIEYLGLADDYKKCRPDSNQPYAQHIQEVTAPHQADGWELFILRVTQAIQFLSDEANQAPARKEKCDAEWDAHLATIAADQAQWQAQQEARQQEAKLRYEQLEAERIKRERLEQELRAEVTLKLGGMTPAAFDYLVDELANAIERRRSY